MATPYVDKILEKVEAKARDLDGELNNKDLQLMTGRLTFLWDSSGSDTTEVTGWRHRRSRQVYEAMQDIDCHLFLAVVLSVNPTEAGQTKFQPVVDYLRNLRRYEAYCFTPRPLTSRALRDLASNPHVVRNERYGRLIEFLSPGEYCYTITSLH